jgi:hypothetical protein
MKLFFLIAGVFNLLVVAGFLIFMDVALPMIGLEVNNSSIVFAHLFLTMVGLFGLAYFCVAFNPLRYKELMLFGALSKILLVIVVMLDVYIGLVNWKILLILVADLIFALMFLRFYLSR